MLRSCLWMSSVFNTIQPIQQNYHLHRLPPGMCFIIFVVDLIHLYSYTSIFPNRHFIKYADNTALVSLLYDGEKEHGSVLDYFLNWCEKSNLLLNTSCNVMSLVVVLSYVFSYGHFLSTLLSFQTLHFLPLCVFRLHDYLPCPN